MQMVIDRLRKDLSLGDDVVLTGNTPLGDASGGLKLTAKGRRALFNSFKSKVIIGIGPSDFEAAKTVGDITKLVHL
jgi:hypothetical protein